MKKIGKILLFNEREGKGFLLTSEREKINFSIEDWFDFDVMPSLGLEVNFIFEDGEAFNILSNSHKAVPQQKVDSSVQSPTTLETQIPHISKTEKNIQDIPNDSSQMQKSSDSRQDAEQDFETECAIDIVKNIQKEIGPIPKVITLSTNLETAVEKYFQIIQEHIERRVGYKKVKGRLDYIVAKRFVWTVFNNLTEMDSGILTPRIKSLSDDLKIMGSVYEDYTTKVKYPPIAFEEVFLSCQVEYKKVREEAEQVKNKLSLLRNNEKLIGGMLGAKKAELNQNIKHKEFDVLNQEFKSLNGAYADVVHMMAELDARHKESLILLHNFEETYRKKFYDVFREKSNKYKDDLVEILNAQAYIVDAQLWAQARISKPIHSYFQKSAIVGELNTKTYLKYYLDTVASNTGDNKKLFELYDYLVTAQKEYTLIVVASAQDALEHELSINGLGKTFHAKSFIDEKNAIKWAMNNSVKVLVIEEMLQKTTAAKFLNVYHSNITTKPKIILLGNKQNTNSNEYDISALLSKNISSKILADNVKMLMNN